MNPSVASAEDDKQNEVDNSEEEEANDANAEKETEQSFTSVTPELPEDEEIPQVKPAHTETTQDIILTEQSGKFEIISSEDVVAKKEQEDFKNIQRPKTCHKIRTANVEEMIEEARQKAREERERKKRDDENRKKEQEKRQEACKEAFEKWCKMKAEETRQRKYQETDNSSQTKKPVEKRGMTHKEWGDNKKAQQKKDAEIAHFKRREEEKFLVIISQEENDASFKDWLQAKAKQKRKEEDKKLMEKRAKRKENERWTKYSLLSFLQQ